MAIGRFTARDSWNMFSSMSRLGFSRSMTMTSGSISAIRRAMPVTSWMTVTRSWPASRKPASMIEARMRFSSITRTASEDRTMPALWARPTKLCNAA